MKARIVSLTSWSFSVLVWSYLLGWGSALPAEAAGALRSIGVAKVDVTPAQPIRLTGYASRKTNSIGVEQKLWAKALAIGTDAEEPAVMITLDNCGIAEATYREVVRRLAKARIKPERLAICCSHTHSGPCTTAWAPNIFGLDIPPDHQATIDAYTRELIDNLEKVALAALKDRRPGKLSWSEGRVEFARNRRVVQPASVQFGDNKSGPVDHALPVLLATDEGGKVRALVANYACHCTTLGGDFNKICGDWAGFAQEVIERDHPGAVAMITIGCGADANPSPRGGADGGLALARQHGEELAAEVKQLLGRTFTPIKSKLTTRLKNIELPFAPARTRQEWEERARKPGITGYHAKKFLARLDAGEKIPETLSYYAQTWNFGDDLAMVFLSGEVVVDYALRLKREFDHARLWVTAYANYVPCYIPSRRILNEGGYEAEDSLWYYDRPTRLSTNIEELIIKTVHDLLPKSFLFDKQKAEFPPPKNVEQALASFRTKRDFAIEAVASEPLIESPVAIDWGADGRLWVCEMYDYPAGLDGKWKPGGRIKVLESSRGDGHYDKATLFLEGIPFPTGIMAWRKGALICAAPDILYAEDTNGDGKADVVKKLFTGFATHNFQARVNGLSWGLDGWIYGASGLFGGKVTSSLTGKEVDLSGRDFRIKPDTGEIEPVAGISQQGRIRDDFGNWFGNDNSTLLWHFPLPEHYIRRNPHVSYPDPRVNVAKGVLADPNQLYPISRTLERFNDPGSANHTTSACGPEIYRDNLLGANYYGNAFICEPVHNLVTRLELKPQGAAFAGQRAPEEQRSEFLSSTDNWFRPVQVRTGPDGALWVVDMYRFVIEHPRWIPPERLKQLDVRAGADKGRIYRLYFAPRGPLRSIPDLTKLSITELAHALDTPNGPERDLIHRELLERARGLGAPEHELAMQKVSSLATNSSLPAVRVQALAVLRSLGALNTAVAQAARKDPDSGVRRAAIRFSEPQGEDRQAAPPELLALERDLDPAVRFQLALSLGEWKDAECSAVLAGLGCTEDPWLRAAVLSSATGKPEGILKEVMATAPATAGRSDMIAGLIATAAALDQRATLENVINQIAPRDEQVQSWQLDGIASLLEALARKGTDLDTLFREDGPATREAQPRIESALRAAERLAGDSTADESQRVTAIRLVGAQSKRKETLDQLSALLVSPLSSRLQTAVLSALGRRQGTDVAERLLTDWARFSPGLRSAIINLLLTREQWVEELLTAAEQGTILPNEISLPNRQRLLKHPNASIKSRSAALLATRTEPRTGVVAKYQSVASLTGHAEAGAGHFEKNCSSCHFYRGLGNLVGPNLGEFAGKSVEDFLVAIFDPNAAINPNFLAYNIETRDGRSLTGIIKGETASSLTLVQGGGLVEKILRKDIQEIRASQVSLMPEGLEQNLSPQDAADLIAWLKQSAPAPFGSADMAQAARARSQLVPNGLAKIISASEQLVYPSWLGRLPLLHCRQTDGQSKVVWQTEPTPALLPPHSTQAFRLPAAMGFMSQPAGKFELRLNGKSSVEFDVSISDQAWQSEDGKLRLRYTVMENNAEDSNGLLVIEAADELLEAGKPAQFEVVGSASQSQRWFGIYLPPALGQEAAKRQR